VFGLEPFAAEVRKLPNDMFAEKFVVSKVTTLQRRIPIYIIQYRVIRNDSSTISNAYNIIFTSFWC